MFATMTVVMLSRVCTEAQIHLIIYVKYVQCFVYQLCSVKLQKKEKRKGEGECDPSCPITGPLQPNRHREARPVGQEQHTSLGTAPPSQSSPI